MATPRRRISGPRARLLVFAVVVALLAVGAWGMGWLAHRLFDRWPGQLPTAEIGSTAVRAETSLPTSPVSVTVPSSLPTSAPRPTSTPMPAPASASAETWETVGRGEGLYQVCRRHCPGRWSVDDAPGDLVRYAREVARLNGLIWRYPHGPIVRFGQELRMPSCP